MRSLRLLVTACAATALLVTSAAAASAAPAYRNYVALGDSYTSGPFIPLPRLDPLGCGRSTANYPALLAASLHVSRYTDVSCAGADTSDMTQAQSVPLSGTNPPQLSALRPDTDLVTLGIGGNDGGVFGTLTGTCPGLRASDPTGNPCQQHFTSGGVDTMMALLPQTGANVRAVLASIHQLAPSAHVILVGYPRIAPPTGVCPAILPFADGDYAWLNSVEQALNAQLGQAADETGSSFVDIYGPSLGHDACAPGGAAWINGQNTNILVAAAYHPFGRGMAGMAAVIRNQLG